MQSNLLLKTRALTLVEALRQHLTDGSFLSRHRRRPQDFTRACALNFPVLMLLLLQKTLKSLQAHLDEFLWQLAAQGAVRLVQASALTHARAKLLPSAFVELNERVLLAHYYHRAQSAGVRRWRGHRLLSIDSSLTRLPDSAELRAHFGVVECANQHGVQESYPQARISILYDLLNQLGLGGPAGRIDPA